MKLKVKRLRSMSNERNHSEQSLIASQRRVSHRPGSQWLARYYLHVNPPLQHKAQSAEGHHVCLWRQVKDNYRPTRHQKPIIESIETLKLHLYRLGCARHTMCRQLLINKKSNKMGLGSVSASEDVIGDPASSWGVPDDIFGCHQQWQIAWARVQYLQIYCIKTSTFLKRRYP